MIIFYHNCKTCANSFLCCCLQKQCHSERACGRGNPLTNFVLEKLWIATVVTLPRNDMELLINFLSKNLHYLETMPVKKQCHSERACERGNPLTNFVLEKNYGLPRSLHSLAMTWNLEQIMIQKTYPSRLTPPPRPGRGI